MLQETFYALLKRNNINELTTDKLWLEIKTHYNSPGRHYHTMGHLQDLVAQLEEVRMLIHNWDAILFALYYHDVVYNAAKSNNEEKSADLAARRMQEAGIKDELITLTHKQILATKSHLHSDDSDTNYFTDADLSILGRDWEPYQLYTQQIRNEYSIYPDLLYKPGRKKVLQHFLQMDQIFKTEHFAQKYEVQARANIARELETL